MLTGRDEMVAELIRQERLYEAEQHRLSWQLPRSRSNLRETVVAMLQRLRASMAAPGPIRQTTAPHPKGEAS